MRYQAVPKGSEEEIDASPAGMTGRQPVMQEATGLINYVILSLHDNQREGGRGQRMIWSIVDKISFGESAIIGLLLGFWIYYLIS